MKTIDLSKRRKRAWFALSILAGLAVSAPSRAQTPIVIFDEDDPVGAGYYDASWGTRQGSSLLTLAGASGDTLPIVNGRASSGSQSGLLQWTSGPGALWGLYVSSPTWLIRDASEYVSLVLTLNGPAAVDSAALPWIAFEDKSNQKSSRVNLATYLPQGLDADTATWQ